MLQSDCLKQSHNRLDRYHLLLKNGKIKMNAKATAKKLVQNLAYCKKMFGIFDYVEFVNERNIAVKHYHKYYKVVKHELKSEPSCDSIGLVFWTIQNNFNILHITTLGVSVHLISEMIVLWKLLIVV